MKIIKLTKFWKNNLKKKAQLFFQKINQRKIWLYKGFIIFKIIILLLLYFKILNKYFKVNLKSIINNKKNLFEKNYF